MDYLKHLWHYLLQVVHDVPPRTGRVLNLDLVSHGPDAVVVDKHVRHDSGPSLHPSRKFGHQLVEALVRPVGARLGCPQSKVARRAVVHAQNAHLT